MLYKSRKPNHLHIFFTKAVFFRHKAWRVGRVRAVRRTRADRGCVEDQPQHVPNGLARNDADGRAEDWNDGMVEDWKCDFSPELPMTPDSTVFGDDSPELSGVEGERERAVLLPPRTRTPVRTSVLPNDSERRPVLRPVRRCKA